MQIEPTSESNTYTHVHGTVKQAITESVLCLTPPEDEDPTERDSNGIVVYLEPGHVLKLCRYRYARLN